MLPTDFVDPVRFVGGFGGLELRSAEPGPGSIILLLVNPGTTQADRSPTDHGITLHCEVSGN